MIPLDGVSELMVFLLFSSPLFIWLKWFVKKKLTILESNFIKWNFYGAGNDLACIKIDLILIIERSIDQALISERKGLVKRVQS